MLTLDLFFSTFNAYLLLNFIDPLIYDRVGTWDRCFWPKCQLCLISQCRSYNCVQELTFFLRNWLFREKRFPAQLKRQNKRCVWCLPLIFLTKFAIIILHSSFHFDSLRTDRMSSRLMWLGLHYPFLSMFWLAANGQGLSIYSDTHIVSHTLAYCSSIQCVDIVELLLDLEKAYTCLPTRLLLKTVKPITYRFVSFSDQHQNTKTHTIKSSNNPLSASFHSLSFHCYFLSDICTLYAREWPQTIH